MTKIRITGLDEFMRKHKYFENTLRTELDRAVATAADSLWSQIARGPHDVIEGEYEVVERRPMLGDGNE